MDKHGTDPGLFVPESFHWRQLKIEWNAKRGESDKGSYCYVWVFTVTWWRVTRLFDSSKSLFQQDESDDYGCINCVNWVVAYVRRDPSNDAKSPVYLCLDEHFKRSKSVIEISEIPRMQICPFWIKRDA